MKKIYGLFCCILLCSAYGYSQAIKPYRSALMEEERPLVLKFEPKLLMETDSLRQRFLAERLKIDTLGISEKRKQRKIRDLYKDIRLSNFKKTELTDILNEENL